MESGWRRGSWRRWLWAGAVGRHEELTGTCAGLWGGITHPSSCQSRPRVSAKGVSAAREVVSLPFRIFLGVWDHLRDAAIWQCYCWVHDDFSLLYVLCKCNKSIARWISAPCMLWPGRRLIYQLLFRYLSFAIVTAGDNTTSPSRPASRGKSRSKIYSNLKWVEQDDMI